MVGHSQLIPFGYERYGVRAPWRVVTMAVRSLDATLCEKKRKYIIEVGQ